MRCIAISILILVAGVYGAVAQSSSCPQGMVCYSQDQNNQIFQKLTELANARDVIAKMLSERNASDAAIASANKLIEVYKQMDVINGQIVAKQSQVIALYEQTIKLYANLVEKLQTQLNKPKSAWQKFLSTVRDIALLAVGLTIGKGL